MTVHRPAGIKTVLLAGSIMMFVMLVNATSARAMQTDSSAPAAAPVVMTRADSLLESRVRNLSTQLRCPVCQGLSLQDSPSELSQQMRDVVRSQLALGKSDEEVKAFFVDRYGEWILMEPEARGFNLVVYVLPFVGLIVGAGVLVWAVRRWTSRPPGDLPIGDIEDDASADPTDEGVRA